MLFFPVEDESGPKPEALNKKAVAIVNGVRDKLTGKKKNADKIDRISCRARLPVDEQQSLIPCKPEAPAYYDLTHSAKMADSVRCSLACDWIIYSIV